MKHFNGDPAACADGDNRDDFWMADKGQVDFCIHEKENRELMIAREAVSKLNG